MPKRKTRPLPTIGSKYEKTTRDGIKHVLTVVGVEGNVKYRLGKHIFDSPSGAAKSLNGGHEVNGWEYWEMD